MKIKGWDKLRYKFVAMGGARLTIDTTWDENDGEKTTYCLTMCDIDNVGDTLVTVRLKEGPFDEFYMKVHLESPNITPNINRVFRKDEMLDMDVFLRSMMKEMMNNGMVNSYMTLLGDLQNEKMQKRIISATSHSINL